MFENVAGPSTKHFRSSRGFEAFVSEKLAVVLDKCKISDRNAVHLLIATAEALGNNVNKLIINRSSIRSARIEFRKERAKKIRQDYNLANEETVVVHWDGKLLPALTGKGLVDRLPIVASVNGHEQLLGVPALNTGTGSDQANAVYQTLVEWCLTENVQAFCSDTTASNTGRLNGACVLLEQLLEREIVYLPCRHHIYEIVLKSVFDLKLSGTSGPDVAIFKRFQLAWVTMDTKMFNSGIENCIVMGSVNDVCDDIIKFSIDRLEKNHPRDDYRELLELTVIFLGGILPNGIHFKKPGAIHHARWMAKAIYSLKIYLFREQFRLTVKEETTLRNICIFIIRLYIKSWFDAPSAIKAPFQDLTFIKNLLNYIAIDKDTSQIAIKKFCGHLWYLSAELCGFAFFDEAVSIDTKRKMVKALNNEKSTSEMLSTTQRIIISPKNANELLEKEIEDFVCVKTNNLFKRFAINTDFLKLDPSTWRSNEDFQKLIVLLKKIPVINDVAERGVQLIEEYNDKITKDESQKQYLLQVVSDYRKKFPDHKKETLITSFSGMDLGGDYKNPIVESDHSHAGDEHVEIVEKAKSEMLKRISTTTSTPSQIFAEVINQVPEQALTSFVNEETTKRILRRQKNKGNPKKPSCLSELIT
ncbi:hypothetical protein QTP88_026917 [Uroleucon formosanum]